MACGAIGHQGPVGLGHPQFPGQARPVDGVPGGGAGAAVAAADVDHLGPRLGHPSGDGAHPVLGAQLYPDVGPAVGVFQVVDQLGQILDGVDIVVGRWGDKPHAGGGEPGFGHPGVDLLAGELAPLAGLGSLGHLNLNFIGAVQVC